VIKSKYGNVKVKADGYTFDSKKEARRYQELKLLLRGGNISELTLQPSFVLQASYIYNGKTIRDIRYVSDFKYVQNGKIIIEDVKSAITLKNPVYLIKKKMFLKKYGDQLTFIES